MTARRRRREIGDLPRGLHPGRVPFLVWDLLDSWPDDWFGLRDIIAHVEGRVDVTEEAVHRALWRLVDAGHITYRTGGQTLSQFRIKEEPCDATSKKSRVVPLR